MGTQADTRPVPLTRPGETCWRIARAERVSLIVDAADYFVAVKAAMLEARHSIYLIGWDFDSRIKFEPEGRTMEGPNKLGAFLRWIDRKRPGVEVHVLKWDLGIIYALGRGTTPLAILNLMTSERIHFKLDGAHPHGAAHHQKIVVVDDVLAFCGGIDMTADRWDTRAHLDNDKRRRRPSGRRYGPWHDASTMVDGDVARALGDLARARWKRASGKDLEPPPARPPIWPQQIEPSFRRVDVAIARTQPEHQDQPEIREVEAFYLEAIARAERIIYCESQYFASRRIAEAMAARLMEPDGPEIVVVNPQSADGFLEAAVMDSARARLIALVRNADRFGRFRIFMPVTAGRKPIYVHAKIMVVDERVLRVGSSNFNNRSMGFDTECDLIIEALPGHRDQWLTADTIRALRDDLIAEHMGLTPARVRAVIQHHGSFIAAIEAMMNEGRSLVPYEPDAPGPIEEVLAENELLDPERSAKASDRWKRMLRWRRRT